MAAHQRQRDQAARVIRPVNVLRNAHAPEDHAGFGTCKCPGDVPQDIRFNPTNLRHFLGREALEMLFLRLPILGEGRDILLIIELFFDNHMHDRIEHGRHPRRGGTAAYGWHGA